MPEGVMTGGRVVSEGAHDDPQKRPGPDYTWDRQEKRWRKKLRPGRGGNATFKTDAKYRFETTEPRTVPRAEPSEDREGKDPDPGWMREDKPKPGKGGKFRYEDVPLEIKNDIAGFAGMAGIPVLSFIQRIDPYCGGALAQQYEEVVKACLPLICRSEKVVKFFSGESNWVHYLALASALQPVATAVYQHHIAKTVEVVRDEHGVPHVRPRATQRDADHLTPPAQGEPSFDYAA